jgi:hypothetical protein
MALEVGLLYKILIVYWEMFSYLFIYLTMLPAGIEETTK